MKDSYGPDRVESFECDEGEGPFTSPGVAVVEVVVVLFVT